jgi:hypothetical protein
MNITGIRVRAIPVQESQMLISRIHEMGFIGTSWFHYACDDLREAGENAAIDAARDAVHERLRAMLAWDQPAWEQWAAKYERRG